MEGDVVQWGKIIKVLEKHAACIVRAGYQITISHIPEGSNLHSQNIESRTEQHMLFHHNLFSAWTEHAPTSF
jgi:hypothetical protein